MSDPGSTEFDMRHALPPVVVLVCASACVGPLSGESRIEQRVDASAPVAWGSLTSGLRVRVEAPTRVARGDQLKVRIAIDVVAEALPDRRSTLDARPMSHFAALSISSVDGSHRVRLRCYDPSLGPPEPPLPPGSSGAQSEGGYPLIDLRRDRAVVDAVSFPLATVWDELPAGDYRAVLELDYGDPFGRASVGTWRGVVRSPPLSLEVVTAPVHHQEVAVSGHEPGSQSQLRLPVRNGFVLGLHSRDAVYSSQPGAEFAELVRNHVVHGTGPWTIFETASPVSRHWSPRRDPHYRALWESR